MKNTKALVVFASLIFIAVFLLDSSVKDSDSSPSMIAPLLAVGLILINTLTPKKWLKKILILSVITSVIGWVVIGFSTSLDRCGFEATKSCAKTSDAVKLYSLPVTAMLILIIRTQDLKKAKNIKPRQ